MCHCAQATALWVRMRMDQLNARVEYAAERARLCILKARTLREQSEAGHVRFSRKKHTKYIKVAMIWLGKFERARQIYREKAMRICVRISPFIVHDYSNYQLGGKRLVFPKPYAVSPAQG